MSIHSEYFSCLQTDFIPLWNLTFSSVLINPKFLLSEVPIDIVWPHLLHARKSLPGSRYISETHVGHVSLHKHAFSQWASCGPQEAQTFSLHFYYFRLVIAIYYVCCVFLFNFATQNLKIFRIIEKIFRFNSAQFLHLFNSTEPEILWAHRPIYL